MLLWSGRLGAAADLVEEPMASTVDSSHVASEPFYSRGARMPAEVDVPGLMATRIGDLYAEEERKRRTERTERMIRKAESFK